MRVNISSSSSASPLSPPSLSRNHPCHLPRSRSFTAVGSPFPTRSSPSIRRSCTVASFDGPDFKKPTSSFRSPHIDVLEPSFLGISPEPPHWPARDAVIRDCMARRASRVDLPVSLRMIKLKQKIQRLEEERESGNFEDYIDDPISNLCNASLGIIKEVQIEGWRIRGLVLDEDLSGVLGKVQKEMTSSFVWLFREVFAKTPNLMVDLMVLTSNFAVNNLEIGRLEFGGEVGLWKSMVEEAKEMKGGDLMEEINHQGLGFVEGLRFRNEEKVELEFVSPVRVEIEGDDNYGEYHHTNLVYQIGLSQDPHNTLLLSNYAQFLWLVSRNYDRAEECFKHALQLDSGDAEASSQYANFLWIVRNDLWGAEERYQQAMAAEPQNSFHASKYASFLWNTGAEDTCYPLDTPQECAE